MAAQRIRLVACIGTRSSPDLVSHFLRHYRDIGVAEFLIILHADSLDERYSEVKARLREHGVSPVREIREYSARLKLEHTRAVVQENCEPQSWVIHADLDELQIYPGGLFPYLEERQRRGHAFARGRLIDRLAPGGELIEIRAQPSIWEQFPVQWPVTRRLAGGWDRKVCAARAAVPLSDGGCHAVAYGRRERWSYWRTHRLPRWREKQVEIHHFKWDATLPQRLRHKLEGSAGDLDRLHGPDFMDQYRRLHEHLARHGRIRIPMP